MIPLCLSVVYSPRSGKGVVELQAVSDLLQEIMCDLFFKLRGNQ